MIVKVIIGNLCCAVCRLYVAVCAMKTKMPAKFPAGEYLCHHPVAREFAVRAPIVRVAGAQTTDVSEHGLLQLLLIIFFGDKHLCEHTFGIIGHFRRASVDRHFERRRVDLRVVKTQSLLRLEFF